MGIMNDGAGWKSYYYDNLDNSDNGNFQSFPEYIWIKDVKIVGIEIEVQQSRKIHLRGKPLLYQILQEIFPDSFELNLSLRRRSVL